MWGHKKRIFKNLTQRKDKESTLHLKDKEKASSKGKKIEWFNYARLRHMATNCPSLKDIKKAMHVTWSDTNLSDNESSNSKDNRYGQNKNYLTFVAFINFDLDPFNDIRVDESS